MAIKKIYIIYDTSMLVAAHRLKDFFAPLKSYWWIHYHYVLPTFIQSEIEGLIGSEKDEIGRKARVATVNLLATGIIHEPDCSGLDIENYPRHLLGADSKSDKYLVELARSYATEESATLIATLDNGIKIDVIRLQQSGENVFCDTTLQDLIQALAPRPTTCPRCQGKLVDIHYLCDMFRKIEAYLVFNEKGFFTTKTKTYVTKPFDRFDPCIKGPETAHTEEPREGSEFTKVPQPELKDLRIEFRHNGTEVDAQLINRTFLAWGQKFRAPFNDTAWTTIDERDYAAQRHRELRYIYDERRLRDLTTWGSRETDLSPRLWYKRSANGIKFIGTAYSLECIFGNEGFIEDFIYDSDLDLDLLADSDPNLSSKHFKHKYAFRLITSPEQPQTYSTTATIKLRYASDDRNIDDILFAAPIICQGCNDIILPDLIDNPVRMPSSDDC